ncbi:stabilization protein [Methylobacterium sp. Leaf456]|uniref:type II toxin-antitoxin system RelE/ParE family toxin n=1 Tax=Methylobacterium sp. Leaf456 TaxID=1736382 RepID=UPI0006F2F0B1|nr:type II toxin-antitoxin system RelE/ParE family toxin [Methylobacterium sp. Leaf456]KQT53590.1 stabilization protein [Methylobacterium sp. Leaf456]
MSLLPREPRFQARALRQIDEALGYVQGRSPQGAAKIEARLTHLIQRLREHPQLGVRTSVAGVRRLYLVPYPYLIDDVVTDAAIIVQPFRHTARRPVP